MSRSLNKVTLIGNLGNDPEVRTTPSGTKVAKVSIATSRSFADRTGQTQEKTDWHRVTFFGKLADIVEQYVSKGDRLYVEGRIEYSQTDDGQGNVRYFTDIVAQEMMMLGGAGGGGGQGGAPGGGSNFGGGSGGGPRGGGFGGGGGGGRAPEPDLSQPDDDLPF
jgi:single-strand DNA-binding protein